MTVFSARLISVVARLETFQGPGEANFLSTQKPFVV